ncbi:MAG TPA: hypothetical protein VJ596_04045 [Gemmatimonadaceae bacterium]|nr:hypothetical protein [Gemmatimonadaceae bacterium]
MPRVSFSALPDDARVWVFASAQPVAPPAAERLLQEVDRFLEGWQAHGAPLTNSRDWRDDRFLVIGVDERSAGASGCSIDGLFRVLKGMEEQTGARLLTGGQVFYRDPSGAVQSAARDEFAELAARGQVGAKTLVFDTAITRMGELRERFETEARRSWHAQLAPELAGADR